MNARRRGASFLAFLAIMILVVASATGLIFYLSASPSRGFATTTSYAPTAKTSQSSYDVYQQIWNSVQITPNFINPVFSTLPINQSLSYGPYMCPTNDPSYCPDYPTIGILGVAGYPPGFNIMAKVDVSVVPVVFVSFWTCPLQVVEEVDYRLCTGS